MTRSEELFSAADRIGYQLCREAIRDGQACNWMGWASEVYGETVSYTWQALGPAVYDGTAGIADFLGSLSLVSGEPLHRSTALAAMSHAMEHRSDPGSTYAAGVFSGAFGVAYAAIRTGLRLDVPDLVQTGLLSLKESASLLHHDLEIDVIGGSAGAIPLLIGIGRKFESTECLDLAVRHGEVLLKRSTRRPTASPSSQSGASTFERYWENSGFGREGLTGYSHGNSGFAIALLELFHLTSDNTYREAATEALAFERRWFDGNRQNWCDLRVESADTPPVSCAWCHGAPGIGLARLRTQELMPDDPLIKDEIHAALSTTLQSLAVQPVSAPNFSLCHGLLGNAELPIAMHARNYEIGNAMESVDKILDHALEQHAHSHTPWKCGTNDGRMTPGLMLGTAGMGLALLRSCRLSNSIETTNWMLVASDQT